MVYFGEVGLSGEVRQVAQAEARLKEAAEARLRRRLPAPPAGPRRPCAGSADGLRLHEIGHLADLVAHFVSAPEFAQEVG